jgi:hypothetical protein
MPVAHLQIKYKASAARMSEATFKNTPNAPYPFDLLRPCREWPRGRCTTQQRNELAPFHSITSSALACSDGGTVRPSDLAVLRLITNSYLVGACTGRSAGFSPLRIRST